MHSISSTSSDTSSYLAALAAKNSAASAVKPSSAGASQTSSSQADTVQLSPSGRDLLQVGRIALNEQAGRITSAQANQLYTQVAAAQKQITAEQTAGGGALSAAQVQTLETTETQTGQQIYSLAHNGASAPAAASSTTPTVDPNEVRDIDQFSRVSLNEHAGTLTSTQASSLDSQIQTTNQQILSELQSNGGPLSASQLAAIDQTQGQLSEEISSLTAASAN